MKKTRTIGIATILSVTVISEVIANLPQKYDPELYGVAQIFAPILVGLIGLVLFLITSFIIKKRILLYIVLGCITTYILYVGLDLHYHF